MKEMEKKAKELKSGESFTIKGKRKKYKAIDVFSNHDYFNTMIYCHDEAKKIVRIKLQKNDTVIINHGK